MRIVIFTFIVYFFLHGKLCKAQNENSKIALLNPPKKGITKTQILDILEDSTYILKFTDDEGYEFITTDYRISISGWQNRNSHYIYGFGNKLSEEAKQKLSTVEVGDLIVFHLVKCINLDALKERKYCNSVFTIIP